jgi:CRISPR-associated protein (TIGR03984 family)
MTTLTLHAWRKTAVTLTDALAAIPDELTGFCASPQAFRFARLRGGTLECAIDDTSQIIEARLGNEEAELRWLRDPAGRGEGEVVLLAETRRSMPDGWASLPALEGLRACDSLRLLTGTLAPESPQPGWRAMNAPRHGVVAVPVGSDQLAHKRLKWCVREYLGPAPGSAGEDGNRIVVEERLLGLKMVKGEQHEP